MRFKSKFYALSFNLAAYKAKLHDYMVEWIKQAAWEWLNATVGFTTQLIPTWSKASRATFQKLAHEIGTAVPYGPQKSRKDREPLGLSTGADSGLEIDTSSYRYHFKYHSSLRYLAYNEYNQAIRGEGGVYSRLIHPTPYHFQERGRAAFEEFVRFTELPDPLKYMKRDRVNA